jgi:hypothetical protein
MQWVTRDRVKVDRVACPWLILRFIDEDAEFAFVPADEVDAFARTTGAVPFDVAGAEIGHHGDRCSFDALLDKYTLDHPALRRLALIVRGADTDARHLCPEAAGLYALASGFSSLSPSVYQDDHALLRAEFPMYDALYEWCAHEAGERPR